jgi:hypothetical protein
MAAGAVTQQLSCSHSNCSRCVSADVGVRTGRVRTRRTGIGRMA